jgi:hypothetical protein
MHKSHSFHALHQIRAIKSRYFLGAAIVCGSVGVISLRANNEHMIKLRDAVYSADMKNDHVEASLKQLQAYVVSHMNTNLSSGANAVYPPVQLKYTYDRLVQAGSDALAKSNATFYTTAQKYCEAQNPSGFFGATRIGCVEDYLTSHDTKHELAPIPDALYKFSFISPRWSPDLAGWSLVAATVSAVAFVVSFTVRRLSK